MDSMRHLSTSLPSARRRPDGTAPALLSDFKAAALSVTNLYKTAAVAQDKARAAGYQDALDDILAFLDRENLGLMDGEGWRVRQWATERLDDGGQKHTGSDDDVEDGNRDDADYQRSSSPEAHRKPAMPTASSEMTDESPASRRTAVSEPPQQVPVTTPIHSREAFTFRSSLAFPTNHDREGTMDLDNQTAASMPSSTETVRIIPRANRNRLTHARRGNASTMLNLNLGSGAGSKRKLPYHDFFDISGFNFDGQDRKDGSGRGGKRGRHA